MHELLIWGSAAGIFFAGFALGTTVVMLHARALSRPMPIPKELMPVLVPAPPPTPPSSAPPPSPFIPKPAKPSLTVREARQASPATRDAYLTEIDRLVTEARAKRKPRLEADELPPLPTRTALPSIHWNDDPHDPQEVREERGRHVLAVRRREDRRDVGRGLQPPPPSRSISINSASAGGNLRPASSARATHRISCPI